MKPFKLTPVYKDYLWGGNKLYTMYKKNSPLSITAESWELSCHKDGCSIICTGEHSGETLEKYISENPSVLGSSVKTNELPILIKFIDAADNLSVQVHPDDELALKLENENGKTEMWYVIDADKDARIIYGLNRDTTRQELEQAINQKKLEGLLNSVPSKKGDVFFVEAGTIHAIGKGNVIAEIQQNSNVTYRLYDYGRVDKNGNERELHIEKGVMASSPKKQFPKETVNLDDNTKIIGECEYFIVKEIKLNGNRNFVADEKSYHAIISIDACFDITADEFCMSVNPGETVFIPAGFDEYHLEGRGIVLITSNPTT